MNGDQILAGFVAFLFVTMVVNGVSIFRSLRALRSRRRDLRKALYAHIENFVALDGWVRARVAFIDDGETVKFETWVVGEESAQWHRLPDMLEATETWGAWLTHELAIENRKLATGSFTERNQ